MSTQRRTHMVVTDMHLQLLAAMEFDWDEMIEFGSVSTDPKRPFGNGGVPDDIERLTGVKVTWAEAQTLVGECSALVNYAVMRLLERADMVGERLTLPWRASRLPAFRPDGIAPPDLEPGFW